MNSKRLQIGDSVTTELKLSTIQPPEVKCKKMVMVEAKKSRNDKPSRGIELTQLRIRFLENLEALKC